MASSKKLHTNTVRSACFVLLTFYLGLPDLRAGTIYFADIFSPTYDDGSIRKVREDGTELETLIVTGGGLRGLDVDPVSGKIYWTNVDTFSIHRSNLDGSGAEMLVTGLDWPSEVTLFPALGTMFWGDQVASNLGASGLDGSEPIVLRSTAFHQGFEVDTVNQHLYWSTSLTIYDGDILRSDLDGNNTETIITLEDKPNRLTLDVAGGKIYWTDYVVDVVRRANLDGTDMENLYIVGSNRNPRGISLDLLSEKAYWGQDLEVSGTTGEIMRMDLDGSSPEVILSGLGLVNDLAFVPDLTILEQPQSLTVTAGQPATLSVVAADIGDISYQWRKDKLVLADDVRLSGSTTPTLTISPTLLADAGVYDVIVTGESGTLISDPATLTVLCDGDANRDGVVDPLDSGFVLSRLSCTYPGDGELCLQADANFDGAVDPLDVGYVQSRFGSCE